VIQNIKTKPSIAGIAVATKLAPLKEQQFKVVLSNSNPNDPSGHYTVFAPTNDAFAKLGLVDAGSLERCKIVS
jgi:uncharacterized surface protein with fasciclin (FAS1) repeats